MGNRFELRIGAGEVDAFVDLMDLEVRLYDAPEDTHNGLGGKQFYRSRSGLSGAGWIPAGPTLRRAATLRVDVAAPEFPRGGEIMPGIRMVVPIAGRTWARAAHFLLVRQDEVFVAASWEIGDLLPRLLRGEEVDGGRPITLGWMRPWYETDLQEGQLTVRLHGDLAVFGGKLGRRRLLELVFNDRLDWGLTASRSDWERGLGLATGPDGKIYHAAGGLLRREAKIDRATLQEECPWAYFLQDSLDYIVQGKHGIFRWVRYGTPVDPFTADDIGVEVSGTDVLEAYRTGMLPEREEAEGT